jgi:hypothetical protein
MTRQQSTTRNPYDLEAQALEEKEQEARTLRDSQLEVADFKWLMAHAEGRRFMHRLLAMTGVFRLSAVSGRSDTTFFNEGVRSVGLAQMQHINDHSLDAYMKMLKEHQSNG